MCNARVGLWVAANDAVGAAEVLRVAISVAGRLRRWWMCRGGGLRGSSTALAHGGPWLRAVSRKAGPAQGRRKPLWVRQCVLALAQQLPAAGYRTLAHTFNLQHKQHVDQVGYAAPVSVSKSFVAQLLRQHRYELQTQLRQRGPRVERIQTTWGMDLTWLPLADGCNAPVLGLIDHGSRALLALEPVVVHNSLVLLGKLLVAIGTHGTPHAVRSDNDAVFKTPMFRAVLVMLRVQQQFTALGSPWQNGRIERFWRTLKTELRTTAAHSQHQGQLIQTRMKVSTVAAMRALLDAFKSSYNHDRPHQSLKGQPQQPCGTPKCPRREQD